MTPDITPSVHIRRAHATDAARLSEFAERIFRETFEAANSPEDMAAYLAEAFGVDRQRAEIAEPSAIVLLAEDIETSDAVTPLVLAAYSHLTPGEAPECVQGSAPVELKRFYVDRAWQGAGLAQMLMRATVDAALESGARTIWLGVWEHNPRAIAFYRKFSFVEVGAHDFMLGRDRQTDIIMARSL
jgi:ribosomal protein S18 acetylase RimI-like enzyme